MFGLATTLCLKSDLFWLQYSVQFREKVRELCLASLGHADYLGFNLPSNSVKKTRELGRSASLRSAMWFILASISHPIRRKNSRALPRYARPCGLFWFQSPVKFRAKFREHCLASLGHVVHFGINIPLNSEKKISTGLPRFARPCGLCWLQSPSNLHQKFEMSASLRSVMWFIFSSIRSNV